MLCVLVMSCVMALLCRSSGVDAFRLLPCFVLRVMCSTVRIRLHMKSTVCDFLVFCFATAFEEEAHDRDCFICTLVDVL